MDRTGAFIDQIYAAALDPAAWPAVMQSLCSEYDCLSAGMYAADLGRGTLRILGLEGIDAAQVRSYRDHHLHRNPWSEVPALQRRLTIRTDRSLDEHHRKPGYYRGTALFNEWMKPQDFIYTLGTNLIEGRRRQIKFFLYRPEQAGPFSDHDVAGFRRIAGHLGNAVAVAQRLELSASHLDAALHVIDRLRIGVMLLDTDGRVTQANRIAEGLFTPGGGLHLRDGVVRAARAGDRGRLRESIRTAIDVHDGRAIDVPAIVSIQRAEGRSPLCATALPLPHEVDHPLAAGRAAALLMVSDPELEPAIPAVRLRQRYGLTVTESRLAESLVQGLPLREAADARGLTYETARWYLKCLFQKTGTRRQAELIRLMLSEQVLAARR